LGWFAFRGPQQVQKVQVAQMYNWRDVARRTCAVYQHAMSKPYGGALKERIGRLSSCGPFFGLIAVVIAAFDALWYRLVQVLDPVSSIDIACEASLRGKQEQEGEQKD
jgi:hypothetical protein